jgi:ketosteroid isomerase-like protein
MSIERIEENVPYTSPLEAITALVAARDAGDIATALGCYAPNPTIVAQPGTVVTGRAAAEQVLKNFVGLQAEFGVLAREILESDTTALHYSRWTLKGVPGSGIDFTGVSTDVFERQADGGWLLTVDNPYGTALVG